MNEKIFKALMDSCELSRKEVKTLQERLDSITNNARSGRGLAQEMEDRCTKKELVFALLMTKAVAEKMRADVMEDIKEDIEAFASSKGLDLKMMKVSKEQFDKISNEVEEPNIGKYYTGKGGDA